MSTVNFITTNWIRKYQDQISQFHIPESTEPHCSRASSVPDAITYANINIVTCQIHQSENDPTAQNSSNMNIHGKYQCMTAQNSFTTNCFIQ